MRDIIVVIGELKKTISIYIDPKALEWLEDIVYNAKYTAPEAMCFLWKDLSKWYIDTIVPRGDIVDYYGKILIQILKGENNGT